MVEKSPTLDPIDERILATLRRDATLTGAALGEAVGLSPSAAHRRLKLLEAAGLIHGYRARLSPAARGHPTTVFVAVTLKDQTQETLDRFEHALRRCDDISEAHLMGGDSDYFLKVAIRADDSFERVHRDVLARLPGVHRLVSHFTIRTVVDPE
jgi:Lrp/AsnC family transcriptional regulator, leucine-responsive regulatory protein